MMPASNRGVGGELHFPDVCKAPAPPLPFIPLPLPNLSLNVLAAPFSINVFVTFVPALNMLSMCPVTTGDEAGVMGGLISQLIKGLQRVMLGNPIVFVNFIPAKNLLCPSSGNLMNAPLGATIIPSITTVLFCYRQDNDTFSAVSPGANRSTEVSLDALRVLAEGIDCSPEERPMVSAELLDDGTGCLRIDRFCTGLSSQVYTKLRRLDMQGMTRLVIDLRDNRGGAVTAALQLADDFLPRGAIITMAREHDGEEITHRARKSDPYRWPLVIAIDERTASAAELFAGSMWANGRAVLVGRPSVGKRSAQMGAVGPEGQGHYGTTQHYRFIQKAGATGPAATDPSMPLPVVLPLNGELISTRGRRTVADAFASALAVDRLPCERG